MEFAAFQRDTDRNIAARYTNIADHLPEEATGVALPFFVDWLLENVHLVEIEAYSDEAPIAGGCGRPAPRCGDIGTSVAM